MIRDIHSWKECKMAVSPAKWLGMESLRQKAISNRDAALSFHSAIWAYLLGMGTLIKNSSAIEEMAEV
jgi:hypothetical protein